MKGFSLHHYLLGFLLIFLLVTDAVCIESKIEDGFPFPISEPLQGELAYIRSYVTDAPAGRHGFVQVEGDRFVFEDGTTARFWGVNLTFGACFPKHHEADRIAKFLSSLGFNIVRLHSIDRWYEPKGIFKKGGNGTLSERQLDRLDYFIHRLKEAGVYVDLNLLVTRDFEVTNEIKEAATLDKGGKPACIFDPTLIELQKEYADRLLSHRNPYTGLTYTKDPAIALIELVNECSLFHHWFMGMLNDASITNRRLPIDEKYRRMLDEKWKKWLSEAHPKLIKGKSSIPRPLYGMGFLHSSELMEAATEFYLNLETTYFQEMLNYLKDRLRVRVPILGSSTYFCLAALHAQAVGDYTDVHVAWDHPSWSTSGWSLKNFQFKNHSCVQDSKKEWLGKICRSMVKGKPFTITEWGALNINRYAYELPLIASVHGCFLGVDALMELTYWNREWPNPEAVVNFFAMAGNPQRLALTVPCGLIYQLNLIQSRVEINTKDYPRKHVVSYTVRNKRNAPPSLYKDKPCFISLPTFPDILQEHKIGAASLSLSNNSSRYPVKRNAEHEFSGIKGCTKEFQWNSSQGLFQVNNSRIQGVTGSLAKQKEIDFSDMRIRSSDSGTILLLSLDGKPLDISKKLFLTVVGEVKNRGAVWKAGEKYRWGNGPAILNRVKSCIFLKKGDSRTLVHLLDNRGNISKTLPYDPYKGIDTFDIQTPWLSISLNR